MNSNSSEFSYITTHNYENKYDEEPRLPTFEEAETEERLLKERARLLEATKQLSRLQLEVEAKVRAEMEAKIRAEMEAKVRAEMETKIHEEKQEKERQEKEKILRMESIKKHNLSMVKPFATYLINSISESHRLQEHQKITSNNIEPCIESIFSQIDINILYTTSHWITIYSYQGGNTITVVCTIITELHVFECIIDRPNSNFEIKTYSPSIKCMYPNIRCMYTFKYPIMCEMIEGKILENICKNYSITCNRSSYNCGNCKPEIIGHGNQKILYDIIYSIPGIKPKP